MISNEATEYMRSRLESAYKKLDEDEITAVKLAQKELTSFICKLVISVRIKDMAGAAFAENKDDLAQAYRSLAMQLEKEAMAEREIFIKGIGR